MYLLGQEKVCQYHYGHHILIESLQEQIENLNTKIKAAEKVIIKLETDLENIKSQSKPRRNCRSRTGSDPGTAV